MSGNWWPFLSFVSVNGFLRQRGTKRSLMYLQNLAGQKVTATLPLGCEAVREVCGGCASVLVVDVIGISG